MEPKIVNIEARTPIRSIGPVIYGKVINKKMDVGEILQCMCHRAIIDEVMPDGSTIRLTMKNYHIDNVAAWYKEHPNFNKQINLPNNDDHKTTMVEKKPNMDNNRKDRKNNHNNRPTNNTPKIEENKQDKTEDIKIEENIEIEKVKEE